MDANSRTQRSSQRSYDYDNLLIFLRELRMADARKKKQDEEARKQLARSESRPMNRLFDKEYIKGKGMKNGGYGGLIVGNHYKIKQQMVTAEMERARYQKWIE